MTVGFPQLVMSMEKYIEARTMRAWKTIVAVEIGKTWSFSGSTLALPFSFVPLVAPASASLTCPTD